MVSELLGVEIEKSATRSDWLHRPFTTSQQHYAALDVAYLLTIMNIQRSQLIQQGKWKWVIAEYEQLSLSSHYTDRCNDAYYLKIKSAWHLRPIEQYLVKTLADWRETAARARNRPRNHVLKEKTLLALAIQQPDNLIEFSKLPDVSSKLVKRDGKDLIEVMIR